jgi:hypothetical protein
MRRPRPTGGAIARRERERERETLANAILKLPDDGAEASKHVGALAI